MQTMENLIRNCVLRHKTMRSAASDLGLHCLPITLLGVSRIVCLFVCVEVLRPSQPNGVT